jgi:transposase-like protein
MAATMGRPTTYSQEMADLICAGMIEGKSIRKICEEDGTPDQSTVFRWLNAQEDFQKQYARAKEEQTTAMAEEILDIADQYDTAKETLQPDLIQRAKLRIDTRKWLMSKMAPKKYGDKIQQEHSGGIKVEKITRKIVRPSD